MGTLRTQANTRPVIEPKGSAFGLFDRDFQPLTSPDPFNALLVYRPPGAPQHRCNPAIPVAPVLASKFDDVSSQCGFVIGRPRNLPLRDACAAAGGLRSFPLRPLPESARAVSGLPAGDGSSRSPASFTSGRTTSVGQIWCTGATFSAGNRGHHFLGAGWTQVLRRFPCQRGEMSSS